MIINLLIALLVVILLFSALMIFLGTRKKEDKKLQDRMAHIAGLDLSLQNTQQRARRQPKSKYWFLDYAYRIIKPIAEVAGKFQKDNSFELKMQRAGWPILGDEFQVITIAVGTFIALITGLLTMDIIMAMGGFMAGIVACLVVLEVRISRRQAAFVNQLGDMLTMIANALRAGFSFMQALDHIGNEMEDPVRMEVKRVSRDVSLGMPLEEALNNMVQRVNSPDFDLVVSAVMIQRQVGGNLANILDIISETIAERIRMRREVMTLTSQGRLSGYVLAALPFALAGILHTVSPGYLDPLFEETMGQIAIGVAMVMIVIGILVIKWIIKIDV